MRKRLSPVIDRDRPLRENKEENDGMSLSSGRDCVFSSGCQSKG